MKNWVNRWKATWNPERYHGWGQSKYFEGWYYKIVDQKEDFAFAIIPGISIDEDGKGAAFIQLMDGKKLQAHYFDYKEQEFEPNSDKFELSLGGNYFSEHKLTIDLPNLKGTVELTGTTSWPKSLGAPGIMGWYSFVPFMQCYHGVVSLHHSLSGSLVYDDQEISFDNGIGYIEKDWGTSFPKCWIWMQSNHFDKLDRKVSLMASVAHIPWLGKYFIGFLVGFYLGDKLYKFATYTGAKRTTRINGDQVELTFSQGKHKLEIIAHKAEGTDLISPISGEMRGKVNESLLATLDIKLYEKGDLIYEGAGRNAGLELGGDIDILLT